MCQVGTKRISRISCSSEKGTFKAVTSSMPASLVITLKQKRKIKISTDLHILNEF